MYKIGISAAVTGIDEKSVQDATDKIQQLMEKALTARKGNKLQELFKLPKPNTEEYEKALSKLNLQITNLKNNIATIKFNTGEGAQTVDVRVWGQTLRMMGNVKDAGSSLAEQYKELRQEQKRLQEEAEGGSKTARVALKKVESSLKGIYEAIREVEVGDAFAGFDEASGSVGKVVERFDELGNIIGRVVTTVNSSGEVSRVFQQWDADAAKFIDTGTEITNNFDANEKAAKKLNTQIQSLLNRERDPKLLSELKEVQTGLAGVDKYSESASQEISNYSARVSEAIGQTRQRERVTREYTNVVRELSREEAELQMTEIEASNTRGRANREAQERIKNHKNSIEVLKSEKTTLDGVMKTLHAEADAQKIEAEEKAKASKKVLEFSQAHEESASILDKFKDGLVDAADRVVNYTLVYRALDTVVRAFKNSIQTAKELDAAFTDIEMVMLQSGSSIHQLKLDYAELAQEMSATIVEVAKGSDEWLFIRSFKTP